MKTCHNMNIIVQNTEVYESSINSKSESHNNTLANITRALLLKSSNKKTFGFFLISITYVSPAELRIDCVMVLLTSYGMEQDLLTNISKYGVRESAS